MASLNKTCLIGHLGRDPEIHSTQNGNKIANLTVATSESWTDKQSGEKRERTEWHKVAVFNEPLVNVVDQYCAKGDKIYVEGALRTRKWTDKDGNDRYSTEICLEKFNGQIILLSSKRDGASPASKTQSMPTSPAAHTADLDDEIPF